MFIIYLQRLFLENEIQAFTVIDHNMILLQVLLQVL